MDFAILRAECQSGRPGSNGQSGNTGEAYADCGSVSIGDDTTSGGLAAWIGLSAGPRISRPQWAIQRHAHPAEPRNRYVQGRGPARISYLLGVPARGAGWPAGYD